MQRVCGAQMPLQVPVAAGHRHRNAPPVQGAGGAQIPCAPLHLEIQIAAVALKFGIGRLAKHQNGHIRRRKRRCTAAVKFGAAAASGNGLLNAAPNRGSAGEVGVIGLIALPGDRPAARLHGDAVRRLAHHQHALPGRKRQHAALVLQQHQRFAHGAARQRAVLGVADQAALPGQRAL